MKYVAWLIAALIIIAGIAAIVAPEFALGLRSLEATPMALLVVAVIRVLIGVVLIFSAPASRAPKALQICGALFLGAGLATPLFGAERAKAVLEWEAAQGPALMRVVGTVVLALGAVLAFTLTPRAKGQPV
jgi:hypothetical protein